MVDPVAAQSPQPQPIKIKVVKLPICQPCLDGIGEECHTAGCALWLHRVDLPIDPELYEVVQEYDAP